MRKPKKVVTMLTCVFACVLMITLAIGTTLAYYNNTGDLTNNLVTNNSSTYIDEEFTPENQWLPGESKTKEVVFGNKGTSKQVIRFRLEVEWLDENGDSWDPVVSDPVTLNLNSNLLTEWNDSFPGTDGWYYYNKVLESGEETDPVLESVTFAPKLSNDNYPKDFSHKTYRIKVYMESVDVNPAITDTEWQMKFTESSGNVTWATS